VIPVDRLHHVSVVVRDLAAAARNHSLVYGIEGWDVAHHTAADLRDTSAFGFVAPYTYSTATGATRHGVTFRLVQPTGGLSTFAEFLVTRGEGIHSICVATLGEADLQDLSRQLQGRGVAAGQGATVGGAVHRWFDTRRALGGYYVEVVAPDGAGTRVDERWDLSGDREPADGMEGIRDAPRIGHLGVAVESLMERLPAYASLLGLSDWTFVHFRPEPGSLEGATLDGEEVRHAFFLAKAEVADLGLELIQPTIGPTHYRRHMLDPMGEGVHHLLVLPDEREERWPRLRGAMEALGAPVATSGRVRNGAAEYFYLDTRRLLSGYLLEAIVRYVRPADGPPRRSEPDYRFDFSTRAPAGNSGERFGVQVPQIRGRRRGAEGAPSRA
jgi:Glyoxalase/Bleomycin resistance protein/Dioxygenase superfamily